MAEFLRTDTELAYFKEMRATCQRTDAPAFDRCPKLLLHAVEFAISPRGVKIAPKFSGDTVTIDTNVDDWPEADKLLRLAPITADRVCEKCNQPIEESLDIDPGNNQEFLVECFGLAGRLLRKQYMLDDAQLAELLAIEGGECPLWIRQLLRWCNGLSTEILNEQPIPPEVMAEIETLARQESDGADAESET